MDSAEVFVAGSGVPDWHHNCLRVTVPLDKWPKLELKVHMCCKKCEEIVKEGIWEVKGVVAVMANRIESKVTVTGCPVSSRVLKKARKVDKNTILVISKKKEDLRTSCPVYSRRQYPAYPETDNSPFLFPYPHYLKHVACYR